MVKGRIHSVETMGLVDGPGIRFVVFMQGCKLRCAYCHNPDTWECGAGEETSAEELVNKIRKYKNYFKSSGGGVTFSGGEPLLQPEFLLKCLKLCKENDIHTTLDTAGIGFGDYEEILKYVDLVMFDIKHIKEEGYKKLVGGDIGKSLEFLKICQEMNKKLWIRQVVVPGITDSKEYLVELKKVIDDIKNVEKIELLPYHVLGVNKYEGLSIKYRLKGVEPMDKVLLKELEEEVFRK